MPFRAIAQRLVILPLVALLFFAACRGGSSGDDTYRNEQVRVLLNQGKALLGKNQWGLAKETFQRVLDDYDPANSQARFGLVLSDLLSFSDTIRLVSSLTSGLGAMDAAEENEFVNQLITDLIHDLRAKFKTIDNNLLLVVANPGFVFRVNEDPGLPIYLSDSETPSMELHGEWDRADAFLLTALVKGVLGVLNYADSVDLRLDVLRAYDYFAQSNFDAENLNHIQSVVTYILNDPNYTNFLGVKPDGGNELVKQAGDDFAAAIYNFQAALYMASIERDDQRDDILHYDDQNRNGRYDPPLDPSSDKCAHLDDVMAEQADADRFKSGNDRLAPENFKIGDSVLGSSKALPFLSEQTACLLQKAYNNLAWSDVEGTQAAADLGYEVPPRINILHDVVPLADALLTPMVDVLISPGLLSSFAEQIIGDSIALNPHAFFSENSKGVAGNVRGLLPIWENDMVCTNGICDDAFVMEVECSPDVNATYPVAFTVAVVAEPQSDKMDVLPCRDDWVDASPAQVSDSTHFDGYADRLADFSLSPIAADGFVGYLPYIAFQDASFHGLLELNLAAMAILYEDEETPEVAEGLAALDSNASDFNAANLIELNAFIAGLSASPNLPISLLRE